MDMDETFIVTPSPRKKRSSRKRYYKEPGLPPETLLAVPDSPQPVIDIIAYGPTEYIRTEVDSIEAIRDYIGRFPVVWVNIDGLGDVEVIRRIGEVFELHGLALEDVLSFHQRPKVEEYGEHLFIVVRMLEAEPGVATEQLSLFVGKGFVVTFQERPGDCLDSVRRRIRDGLGRIRQMGADYLAYSIIDTSIDAYFPRIEQLSDAVEDLEIEVLEKPTPKTVARIHQIKRDLLSIRRVVSPLREVVSSLRRDGANAMSKSTQIYLRDCYDHTIHILELVEVHREVVAGLLDIYLTSVSNRTNQIMKVLTIISTVFIPLTFMAGIYGMNFDTGVSPLNMPELTWYWGYPMFLLVITAVAVVELVVFWRKGWLSGLTGTISQPTEVPDELQQQNSVQRRTKQGEPNVTAHH